MSKWDACPILVYIRHAVMNQQKKTRIAKCINVV